MSLCDLEIGLKAVIKSIDHNEIIRRRLYDMGFTEGALVKADLSSPSQSIKGYLIRGSLIALRDIDAKKIIVSDVSE